MDATVPQDLFETAYESELPGWVIGEPQPAIVALEQGGGISGNVLDVGCGLGEHTIHLARLGYDVYGIDFAKKAVDLARRNADEHRVSARFEVADALRLEAPPRFDTVVDSALFHVFGEEDRARYARVLHAACKPGALVHVLALALSDEPGFGPRISDTAIRTAFVGGWQVEDLRSDRYRAVAHDEHANALGVEPGTAVDLPAWLARVRRT